MKSTKKVQRFDYSKYESDPMRESMDNLKDYQFWGIHPKNGRIHIDTKRYIAMCEKLGANEYIYDGMKANRDTPYLIPKKIHREDYKVNIFRDLINSLKVDWLEEYQPIFQSIKTPKQVYEESRTERLCYMASSEDYDDIDVDAKMDGFRRISRYNIIMNSLFCTFIMKVATEIDRYTLIFMKQAGYKGNDFSYREFVRFTQQISKGKKAKELKNIDKFNAYNMLRKINNFLKHNSIESYNDLKKHYPNNVASVENGTAKYEYENGMFAGDWIIVKSDYITNLLNKLIIFFESYCQEFLDEDLQESKWNYDDFFKAAKQDMSYVDDYLGLNF